MKQYDGATARIATLVFMVLAALAAQAQVRGTGSEQGTVTDPTGVVVPEATVHLFNKASGFDRETASDSTVDFDVTAINVANKNALYNFLSTFSGTHYVTSRTLTAKVTMNF